MNSDRLVPGDVYRSWGAWELALWCKEDGPGVRSLRIVRDIPSGAVTVEITSEYGGEHVKSLKMGA